MVAFVVVLVGVGSIFGAQYVAKTMFTKEKIDIAITNETIIENGQSQVFIEYPQTENELINQLVNQFVEDHYGPLKQEEAKDPELIRELHITYELIPYNNSIVSFFFTTYTTSSYLAHGINTISTFTFDMKTGNLLVLSDLFDQQENFQEFESLLSTQIKAIVSDENFNEPFLNEEQIEEVINNTKNFTITKEALVVYYEPYVIAPGYMSTQTIELPLESVRGLKISRLDTTESETAWGSNALSVYNQQKHEAMLNEYKDKKLVALTFDDGPHQVLTPRLLSILKEKDVKATFFMLGSRVVRDMETTKRVADAGHSIGSHAFTHLNLVNMSASQAIEELNQTQEAIKQATGKTPTLMRPPYGAYNDVVVDHANAAIIMWSVDPMDWKYRDSAIVKKNVLDSVKDGSIVLLHDIHATSVDAVTEIIDSLHEQGYTLVTVDTLLEVRQGLELSNVYFAGAPQQE